MNHLSRITSRLPVLVALFAAGCGGGGGGGGSSAVTATPPPVGETTAAVVSVGVIDGFGSVIVNGVHYDTDGATIIIDGQPASEFQLAVGQVVVVTGSIQDDGRNGSARHVEYDDNAKGRIEQGSMNRVAGTFRVMGQTVLVNALTHFDDDIQPQGLDGLIEGDKVEVSGLPDSSGQIIATRIELYSAGSNDEFELTGLVESLDTAAMRFSINDLVVDYSAAQLDDFPAGEIRDRDLVEAEGNAFGPNGELLATRVELKDELRGNEVGDDGDQIEVEGLITAMRSPSDFDVSGIRVMTDGRTRYERGSASDLMLDAHIEVKGDLTDGGAILARKIEFENESEMEIEAFVDAVDRATGKLTMLSTSIQTNVNTRFEDDRDDLHFFSISDVQVGDFLEVRIFSDSDVLIASRVERDDADDEVEVEGPASDVAAPMLSIIGVPVLTGGGTEFRDSNDLPISAETFFATADGHIVKASGTWNGTELIADEVEFE